MPQQDRHKDRRIPIEFDFYDRLETLPMKERCSIVLLSCGNATVKINNQIRLLVSPCVLCLSQYDTVELIHSNNLSAKSFHFDPHYIKACLCFLRSIRAIFKGFFPLRRRSIFISMNFCL